ncbi:hypothetical protein N0V87_006020 [Didymella glomerata]|uniref:NmrA-like domain-containing protein n=1 Tax=Didymella glomerata TaxID=749621 RepID=A0A9W9C0D4_9PLEO|nr:hypothetical protein N0V87_006020 [Didymella glomerata]
MPSSDQTVLVFGPAGAVGCAAAIEAHRRGAHVWLAMRDPKKTIKGLSAPDLESKRYTKVQADLMKPGTLKEAVEQSGATSAFVYTVFESKDSMRGTFETLKAAGIQHVVVLSSFTVKGPAEDEKNMERFIEAAHAKTEVALKESGLASTAVRPMYFTSNLFWYTDGIRQGKVELLYPNIKFDYISPTDIGTVCGAVLSEPRFRSQHQQIIPLCGPQLYTQSEAIEIIGQTLGRNIKIQELNEDQFYEKQTKQGMPPPVIKTITEGMRKSNEGHNAYPDHAEVSKNVSKYAERDPMTLTDWVNANKGAFAAA